MKTLFDTTHIGHMTLKNRFIRAAVGEKKLDEQVNEPIMQFYQELARGGCEILIKINVNDGFEDEVMFEDVLYLCNELTKLKIDAIEVSGAFTLFPRESTSYFRK
jgi:2,4-dienoyl-CoA reductase-like NADH-dependent reductase (Old Yellow Enzyme family)